MDLINALNALPSFWQDAKGVIPAGIFAFLFVAAMVGGTIWVTRVSAGVAMAFALVAICAGLGVIMAVGLHQERNVTATETAVARYVRDTFGVEPLKEVSLRDGWAVFDAVAQDGDIVHVLVSWVDPQDDLALPDGQLPDDFEPVTVTIWDGATTTFYNGKDVQRVDSQVFDAPQEEE